MDKGQWHNMIGLVIALVAILVFLSLTPLIADIIQNPEERTADGLKCRAWITASARLSEASGGLGGLEPDCKIIEKTIPLRDRFKGKDIDDMNSEEFRKVVMGNFVELIAKAWWITAEGDRSGAITEKVKKYVAGGESCFVVYAVRIDSSRPDFTQITEADLRDEMSTYSKAEVFMTKTETDQKTSVLSYVQITGVGAGVFVKDESGTGAIKKQENGNDAIYGIGVGFEKESALKQDLKDLLGYTETSIRKDTSFILIAPIDQIGRYCGASR